MQVQEREHKTVLCHWFRSFRCAHPCFLCYDTLSFINANDNIYYTDKLDVNTKGVLRDVEKIWIVLHCDYVSYRICRFYAGSECR